MLQLVQDLIQDLGRDLECTHDLENVECIHDQSLHLAHDLDLYLHLAHDLDLFLLHLTRDLGLYLHLAHDLDLDLYLHLTHYLNQGKDLEKEDWGPYSLPNQLNNQFNKSQGKKELPIKIIYKNTLQISCKKN